MKSDVLCGPLPQVQGQNEKALHNKQTSTILISTRHNRAVQITPCIQNNSFNHYLPLCTIKPKKVSSCWQIRLFVLEIEWL